MPVSDAQKKAVTKYMKVHYDRITISVPKGKREEIKAAAKASNASLNSYIVEAINKRMESEKQD